MRLAKKATAIALASVMAMSLAGCSSKPAESSAAATEAAATAAATEAATTAAATTAAAEAATTAAAAAAGSADVADKKVGISIYKFDENFMTLYRTELDVT